ncbi:putative POX domain-containing protein [Helianthus anomalus]
MFSVLYEHLHMFDPINVALVKILCLLLFEMCNGYHKGSPCLFKIQSLFFWFSRIQTKNSRTNFLCAQVDRRYKQYYHQMQIIILSFEVIAKGGAAKTYTSFALETNSCRFLCLRDAINS